MARAMKSVWLWCYYIPISYRCQYATHYDRCKDRRSRSDVLNTSVSSSDTPTAWRRLASEIRGRRRVGRRSRRALQFPRCSCHPPSTVACSRWSADDWRAVGRKCPPSAWTVWKYRHNRSRWTRRHRAKGIGCGNFCPKKEEAAPGSDPRFLRRYPRIFCLYQIHRKWNKSELSYDKYCLAVKDFVFFLKLLTSLWNRAKLLSRDDFVIFPSPAGLAITDRSSLLFSLKSRTLPSRMAFPRPYGLEPATLWKDIEKRFILCHNIVMKVMWIIRYDP